MRLYLVFVSSCAALLAAAALSTAHAAVWNYGTRVGLSSDWNDNPSLADDSFDNDSTFRFLATYDGDFERRDDNSILTFRPRVTRDYYPDSQFSNLETTDLFLPGSFNLQRPTRSWTLGFNAAQQSILSSEEVTSQGITVGLLQSNDKLTRLSLAPGLIWRLSERDELAFGLNYGLSDYDLEFTGRSDSTVVGGNTSYRRSLNERHTVGITALISSSDADRKARIPIPVDPPTNPPTIDRIELGEVITDSSSSFITADYSYALSNTSSLNLSYGLQDATTETSTSINSTGESISTGSLDFSSTTYNVVYQTEGMRSKYSMAASRTVSLDITNGQPQDRDELRFEGEYEITERLLGSWRIIVWQQEAIALTTLDENDVPIDIRSKPKYADATARLSWTLTRKWRLTGAYQYRRRTNDQRFGDNNFNLKAVSNSISMGITYIWKEMPR